MKLILTAEHAALEGGQTANAARTLRGLALPYGQAGRTSIGIVTASRGSVTWPTDTRRVKVFSNHGRERPVGYVTSLDESDEGLRCELHIGATADGDQAMLEAAEGVRDCLSVELDQVDLAEDGEIRSAVLSAIALVPLPAFSDAVLAAELTQPGGTAMETEDQTPDVEAAEMTLVCTVQPKDTGSAPPKANPFAPGGNAGAPAPAMAASLNAGRVTTQPRTMSFEQACSQIAASYAQSDRSAASLNAALADVTVATTTSGVKDPYQWLGEVWTPEYQQLNWSQAAQRATLTNMTITGWKRTLTTTNTATPPVTTKTRPEIASYAGGKAEIPTSGTLAYQPVTVNAHRHAVGADFDRIWTDFNDNSIIETWLRLVNQSYAEQLDTAVGTLVLSEATDGGTATTLVKAVKLASKTLKLAGATTNWIAISDDLFEELMDITADAAPWWLTKAAEISLRDETAAVNGLSIFASPVVPDGTVLAGDRRAVTQYLPSGNPYTVRAVDLAHGGLDVAVFGYSAELVNDPLGIVSVVVDATP